MIDFSVDKYKLERPIINLNDAKKNYDLEHPVSAASLRSTNLL